MYKLMTDNNLKKSPEYRVAYSMYVTLGGDPTTEFSSVEDIYNEVDVLFGKGNNRITVETIAMEIVENGDYNFNDDEVTGYKPVNIKVEVPQKYTDEQVETIRVEAETNGYNNGYGVGVNDGYNTGYTEGFTQGETEGYNDGYAEGLDDGAEDQKALLESITISENGTYTKEDGYNEVVVEIAGSGGGEDGFDFSVIGYDESISNQLNNEIRSATQDAIDYSKQIYDNWNPDYTSLAFGFQNDIKLKYFPIVNTSKVRDMSYTFYNCSNLTTIPQLDTSNVTNMQNAFSGCANLAPIPQLNTSNVTNMFYMFANCSNLTTIPQLDTSNVTNMQSMLYGCSSLTSIPELDCSKVSNISTFFGFSDIETLTDLGGFKNLGEVSSLSGTSDGYFLVKAPNLTYTSMMNVINNLYDRASAGYSVLSLRLLTNQLSLLSDEEKAIATNKGWTLA